ncbi:hypothetical protein J6590_049900 [Homalodisca vitripennis]|nr:hypothetical protein J6590_049900 [Homalodisca vitripennis]
MRHQQLTHVLNEQVGSHHGGISDGSSSLLQSALSFRLPVYHDIPKSAVAVVTVPAGLTSQRSLISRERRGRPHGLWLSPSSDKQGHRLDVLYRAINPLTVGCLSYPNTDTCDMKSVSLPPSAYLYLKPKSEIFHRIQAVNEST